MSRSVLSVQWFSLETQRVFDWYSVVQGEICAGLSVRLGGSVGEILTVLNVFPPPKNKISQQVCVHKRVV